MAEIFLYDNYVYRALREIGYQGYAAYEMCSSLHGGGSEENLDRCVR